MVGYFCIPVFKKRSNFLNSSPTSTEGEVRLLSAPSGGFWQQSAIYPVSLWTLVVELHPLNWARAQAVRRINPTNSLCIWRNPNAHRHSQQPAICLINSQTYPVHTLPPISLKFILILSIHSSLGVLPSRLCTKTPHTLLCAQVRATCLASLILFSSDQLYISQ